MVHRVKRSKRHPIKDNAPVVIIGVLAVLLVGFIIIRGILRPPDQGWKTGLTPEKAPVVTDLGPPKTVNAKEQLQSLSGWDGEKLTALGCQWCLQWDLSQPQAALDLLFFEKLAGAEEAMVLGPQGGEVRGLGQDAVISDAEIRFRQGRVVARLTGADGATIKPEDLELKAREVDRMVIRSFGRFP